MKTPPKYDSIGGTYTRTRQADHRIVSSIVELLGEETTSIADIGAGTGNYSRELAKLGKKVLAIEPSTVMINQARPHANLRWAQSTVEELNSPWEIFDAAICTLSIHHFNDLKLAIQKIFQLLKPKGKLLIFSADPRLTAADCWIKSYFEPLYRMDYKTLPTQGELKELLESTFASRVSIKKFMLPPDLTDQFFYAAWKYPERYLEESFRRGTSVFSLLPEAEINELLNKLENDLKSGRWDESYSRIRNLDEYDGGYFFMRIAR